MWFLILAGALAALDLIVKQKIERMEEERFPVKLGKRVLIVRHHNYGFARNRLDSHPKLVLAGAILGSVLLAFCSVFLVVWKAAATFSLGLAFLIGGGTSNVSERIGRGYVVDYLRFPKAVKRIRTLIFNLGDFFLIGGAILSVLSVIFLPDRK